MTSFVRPLFISLLCGMAAIGHAPVWLHVAGCDHESHLRVAVHSSLNEQAPSTEKGDCHHGCCHHNTVEAEGVADESSDHSHDGHHSDSCFLCQSLGVPNGVGWQLTSPSVVLAGVEITKIPSLIAPESSFRSIPHPRGPPTPLA
ncbi:DUF2946 domain-containing protein [Neorhodopirellula pilleata]|uniref:DUF2946 domain-containing protein n=1 Tax=Neorhodopirellula pilleata TaxID=2714738 RepID=A0A5C6A1U9_9BACT|nr:DUF2946 domain-containing protein [Neorhodopirellula pilleata]TWT93529.1 hypothetical protein Pla100_40470 [Neorhodopirellula pilleata]